jgi:Predicted periplasmic solute-binding protein
MVDKRSLLLGLGIGLIAGALLLQLMLAGREQSERLAQIGRLSGEDALYSQSEVDALIAETEARVRREYEQAAAGGGADSDQEGGSPQDDGADESGAASADGGAAAEDGSGASAGGDGRQAGESPAVGAEAGAAAEAAEPIDVRIKPGMTLTETARLLESKGVVDDAQALMELMARMSTKIRAGYYTFTGNETLEEVRTIITSPPSE